MWTTVQRGKSEILVYQSFLTSTMADNIRRYIDKILRDRRHDNFERKAYVQSDKNNCAWVWTAPKGDLLLNAR
jgi:hypothetical protein